MRLETKRKTDDDVIYVISMILIERYVIKFGLPLLQELKKRKNRCKILQRLIDGEIIDEVLDEINKELGTN